MAEVSYNVTFYHKGRNRTFHFCKDLEDAKARYQWRYGYWPLEEQVVDIQEMRQVERKSNE